MNPSHVSRTLFNIAVGTSSFPNDLVPKVCRTKHGIHQQL